MAALSASAAAAPRAKIDSLSGSGSVSGGELTFTISATSPPGQPLSATGTFSTTSGGVTTDDPITCLNVVDRKDAYISYFDGGSPFVVLFTIGKAGDALTAYAPPGTSPTFCSDPSMLPAPNGPTLPIAGAVTIVDG